MYTYLGISHDIGYFAAGLPRYPYGHTLIKEVYGGNPWFVVNTSSQGTTLTVVYVTPGFCSFATGLVRHPF